PYRTSDDARTHIGAKVTAPQGQLLSKVWLVLDENPMPVSAVFAFDRPLPQFSFDATMRINGPTPLHVIAQTSNGALFMAEGHVKTSGQGACAAPPGTDPEEALATLGDMLLQFDEAGSLTGKLREMAGLDQRLSVDIQHPSHSGMQMDQISLLFIPMRYVDNLDIELDGQGYVDITGSISLSENPALSLSVPADTARAKVTLHDTDGTSRSAEIARPGY
ncbi:MAG: thiosulfate oxidation carrier protein SoxY, partial [Mangrovicoccus sp.]